ncbi:MAG: outer membrane lipoprotein-sorting protein [Proteobacteria bacterium]|nr:outer membrane lipoprotein-sorting protein [Pseudomonadota bacterium]MBU1738031.1 outer membrane lipoprotein-sorting protein [Pseudomonadota bacterium]
MLLCISTPLSNANEQPDIDEIIDKIDRLFRSESSRTRFEMRIETPDWQRTLQMEGWSEGLDKAFIRILSPKKETGTATLRIENEMWNYFPKINKVMKVPPSMMMGSWMGSDFTNDDIVKESSMRDDYTASLIKPQDAESGFYYAEFIPREDSPIVWGRIVAKVRKEDYIPVREEFYDEKGTLMRIMVLKEIKSLGGKTIPAVMELIPLNKKGHRTIVTYTDATFDLELPKDIFTLRNLQQRR